MTTVAALLALQGESEGDLEFQAENAPADSSYESLADYLFSNLGRQRRSFWDFGL
jgi:hypothetical protein